VAEGAVDLGDTAVTLLQAMVEDSLRRDVRRLERINAHLVGDDEEHAAVQRLRAARGRPPYRHVPHVTVAPDDPFEIGDLAIEVFRSRYRGWRALRDPDVEALHRLLGGDSPLQGELLSFVLFDDVFHRRLVEIGRRDARRVLAAGGALFAPAPAT
jgi:NTE family protein